MSIQCGFMAGVLKQANSLRGKTLARLFLLLSISLLAMPWSALALTATTLGDYDNITVLQVSGSYDVAYVNGAPDMSARRTIAREFYRTHGDDYDMLVIFTNFDFVMPPAAKAFYSPVKNDIRGIGVQLAGQELFDYTNAYSPAGTYLTRLNGTIDMANIASHVMEPTDPKFDDTLMTLTHEFLHRWGAYVHFMDGAAESSALLGSVAAHWSYLLDSEGSTLYGNNWRDNGDGTFTTVAPEQAREGALVGRLFSPLDLYLMGLIDKTQVPPLLLIDAPGIDRAQLPTTGETIAGVAKTVTIDDIIAAEGERIPSAANSRKEFRLAFIYAVTPGTWSASDAVDRGEVAAINRLRTEWEKRFSILTDGAALMRTAFVVAEPMDTNPGVPMPTDPSALAPSVNNGVSWLVSRQQPGGFWQDQSGTEMRDTAAAVTSLKVFTAGAGAAANGQAWLGTVTPENIDFLARKLLGLNSASAADLVSRQNADGGWGIAPGYGSNPVDTALVLQSLSAHGGAGSGVLTAAIGYLHAKQNPDGGWNAGRGGSQVQSTARALLALNSHRGSYSLEPVIADGLAWLTAKQNGDGGFGNSPSTVIDTALALEALKATGFSPTAATNAVTYLLNRQDNSGSWNGSVFQTAQAVAALYAGQVAADLAVEPADISINPSMVTATPSTVTVTVVVHNLGSNPVAAVNVALYEGDPALGNLLGEQTVNIPGNGSVQATFSVTVTSAGLHEYHASVDSNRQVAEVNEWNNTASKTLAANMAPPTVGFAQAASAGSEAVTAVPLAVTLNHPWPLPITVNYAVNAASTATSFVDYTLAFGTLTFAADETSKSINFAVINDLMAETDETVIVDLSNPSSATLGVARHTYTIRDDEAPVVTINSPLAGVIGQPSPQLLYTTTGGNVVVKVDGTVVAKVSGNTLNPLVDGAHFVEVSASNSYGVVTTARVNFTVDTSLPTITIRSPLADAVTNARPLLDYTVTSTTRLEVLVDGAVVGSTSGSQLGLLTDGMHTLTINAWNAMGSKRSSQVAFQVDARPPQVDILSPGNEFIREANPVLRCRIGEAGQISVWLDGIETAFSVDQPIGPLGSGVHRLRVDVTDTVGNVGTDEVVFAVTTQGEEVYGVDFGWPQIVEGWFGGIAADHAGNIYVVTNRYLNELNIAKYDSAGRQLWQVVRPSDFAVLGDYRLDFDPWDVAVDSRGNIYVACWGFSGARYYSVLAKYDATGKYVNHILFNTGMIYGNVKIMSVYVDDKDQIYIAGYTDNDLFGTNNQDEATSFVAKYSQDFTRLYARSFGTSSNPAKIFFNSRDSLAVDKDQNIFVTGVDEYNRLAAWKLNPDLTQTGVSIVGPDNTCGLGIDVDLSGNLYLSGRSSSGGAVWKYSSVDGQQIPVSGSFTSTEFSSLEANEDGTVIVLDDTGTVRKLTADFAELWSKHLGWGPVVEMVMSATGQLMVGGYEEENEFLTNIAVMSDPRIPRFNFSQADYYSNGNPVVLSGYLDPGYDVVLESGQYDLLDYNHEPVSGAWQMAVAGFAEGNNLLAVSVANAAGFVKRYETRVVVDTVAPHITIQAPTNGTVWSSKPWLSYTARDGEVRVFVNGVEETKTSGSRLDSLRPGENRIRVQSTDLAGNVAFAEVVIQATGAAVGELPLTLDGVRIVAMGADQTVIDAGEDAAGNIYVFGGSAGSISLYVAKFDPAGDLVNVWTFNAGASALGMALAVKPNGEFSIAYNDYYDLNNVFIHIDTYAANGVTKLWSDVMSSGSGDAIHDLAIDAAGNLYACGETQGRLNNKRYGGGNNDYFLLKYSPQGSRLWTVLSGVPTTDALKNIVAADDGFLYGMGKMTDAVRMTLFKFDLNGTLIWSKDYNSTTLMFAKQMERGQDGSFYTFFERQDSATSYYYYVTKHDPLGNFVNIIYEQGSAIKGQDLALDAASNVYVTGYSDDPNGWGWSFAGNRSFGDEDIFIAKYAATDLQRRWTRQIGDAKKQQGGILIFSRTNGHAYLAGIEGAEYVGGSNSGQDLFFAPLAQLAELPAPLLTIADYPSPTRQRTQVIHGVTTPGATVGVTVTAPAGSLARVSPPAQHADGNWSFTVDNLTANVDNVLIVSATNAFGTTRKTVTTRVDTLPPTLTVRPVNSPTNANIQTVTGTIEAGSTLTVEVNPPAATTPVTVTDGTWSYAANLLAGDNSLVFVATDAVGNMTVETATITLVPPTLTVSPSSIAQGEPAAITLTIEQFDPASPDVRIETIRDVGGDGLSTDDPVVRMFSVRDGVVLNNPSLPGDEDGQANGRIVTTLRFDYLNDVQMAPGDYLVMAHTSPAAAVASFRVAASSQTQTVQGYVLDPRNTPLGGATVQLLDKWGRNHGYAFTDSAGHYLFNVPKPGAYLLLPTVKNLVFTKANLTPHTLVAGQHLSVDLPMFAGAFQVEGEVREAGTALPVPGGVLVRAENDQYVAAPMTRVYGAYQLDLPAGDYALFADAVSSQGASALGYLGSRDPLARVKVAATSTDNHLSLGKGNTLACGRVVDPANLGVAGLVIEAATDSGSGRFATAVSDNNGNYCLGLSDEGGWQVALNDDADQPLGYVGRAVSGIMMGTGALNGIDLAVFPIEGAIEGLISENGQPVAGLTIKAICAASGAMVTGKTAADGSYRLGVHAGVWQVTIAAEALGYNPLAPVSVTVAADSSADWDFIVTKPIPPVSVTVDPVTSPITQSSQAISGSRSTNATVTVAVNTAATVGGVDYPTATTWQCTISNLAQGPNVVTVSATDGTTQFAAPMVTIDYQPPQMVNTIVITKANYDTRKNVLSVEATSHYDGAQLQVVDYGPMTFSSLFKGKYYWTFSRSLPAKPATITVSGPEGLQTATVR